MTPDYQQFLPPNSDNDRTKPILSALEKIGWQAYFAQQVSLDELRETPPVRVTQVHRSGLHVSGEEIDTTIPPRLDATVGDWLLYNRACPDESRVLERKSLFKRRAPGTERRIQLIAANIDTAFIVSSCNQDFNVARLERYIALAFEADATPVIVLTKLDLCKTPDRYIEEARAISDLVSVVALDARGEETRSKLAAWCKPGHTLAFLGSSGVGKSTLTNALSGAQAIETQSIREDDAKGRHTTTHRQLHIMPAGYAILDSPGMRELQLTDVASGVETLFSDLHDLSRQCRFRDCKHEIEPGCALLAALEKGTIDRKRLARWNKLTAEDRLNSSSLAERRAGDKALGKTIRVIKKGNRK